ncbi:Ribosomal protein S12 methylthiotransferase RimO [compost metagenome]
MEIQRSVANEIGGKYIGQILDVLVERYDGRSDVYVGRSQFDAPEIDGEVYVSNCSAMIGDICKVRITHAYEYDLSGEGVL